MDIIIIHLRKKKMSKLIIFDYTNDSIHIFDIVSDVEIDDCYVQELGFSVSNCDWKVSDHLEIILHHTTL